MGPSVALIAWTHFEAPEDVAWSTDAEGGQALAEFAGRACYQSWSKPNPATATNAGYLAHILEVGHLSVLEHGSVTFYFTGVSRSFTHELIRHRHFSYSQLSQRYVPERDAAMVEPRVIAEDPELHKKFVEATEASVRAYTELLEGLEQKVAAQAANSPHKPYSYLPGPAEGRERCRECEQVWPCPQAPTKTAMKKAARQAARAVLPNATETRIVVTGNYRAWRHFIGMRATEHADVEIRELAVECLRQLQRVAPNVFTDFVVTRLPDGSEVATSPHTEES
ncbi:FAD-dependent thymidylate synthase [Polymorphospora lycopeni]|uniref:Flavin-dependent thymidylate synthase n=1 Tax=Polymorphospora lycopeni TaxID=3140240 RepID=A0ABV5CKR7_9ACTN